MLYKIYAGLGGGFGGAYYITTLDCENEDEANREALYEACEIYDNHSGSNGLRDVDQIMEEDDVDAEEAIEIFNEERESWLDYYAILETEENKEEE